jgi:uncharacterized protein (DUF58 family)
MTELLDPAFVRELELLRRRLSIRTRSGEMGERSATRRGSSAEFLEHRGYAPGDDLRRIDWLAYARSGQAVTKLYKNDEDAAVRLLLDASSSLDFGEPNKFLIARKLAAAIGYMALAGSQRAQLLIARERDESNLTGVERALPVRRGRSALGSLLRELEEARATGRADLARAVSVTLQRASRPGLLVVLSDFLDPGPVTRALTQARAAGHEVVLVQVLAEDELAPRIEGDFSLEDAETGELVEVAIDASALEAYAARLAGLLEELRAWSRRHGAAYVRARTDENLEGVVRRVVSRAID